MRIGIITFHWGTNYGGVLQAFALQQFLKKEGHDVKIINYAPYSFGDSFFKCFTKKPRTSFLNVISYFKEKHFVKFRKRNLNTTERYYSLAELQNNPPQMDAYISGSDQVWNPYVAEGYGKPYYLNFGSANIKRIAYAVSLGCSEYPENIMKGIKRDIDRFDAISVREKTGLEILNKYGFSNIKLLPDPTLLLQKEDFFSIIQEDKQVNDFCFFYILQENQKLIHQVYSDIKKKKEIEAINSKRMKNATMSIEDWLKNIKEAEFVITNSFHGIVFSILFEKKFVAIPVEGKLEGMNDRLYTLLDKFNLRSQLLEIYDSKILEEKLNANINWHQIAQVKEDLKKEAIEFFNENLR